MQDNWLGEPEKTETETFIAFRSFRGKNGPKKISHKCANLPLHRTIFNRLVHED